MRTLLLLIVAMTAAAASAQATRVLVLPAPGGTSERAIMVSEEFGSALAARGFSVMTTGDVRSLFRASGCIDGFTQVDAVRNMPFQMLKRLSDQGVGVVYGGEVGRLDNRTYVSLVAIDTANAEVVARERVTVSGKRPAKKILKRARQLRKDTSHLKGKRIFAGIGGSTGPRATKDEWTGSLTRALKAQPARFNESCSFPQVSERFDVVVQARIEEGGRLIVDGQDARKSPLFSSTHSTRRGVSRAVEGAADEVQAEISRVSLVQR
jgi:hypothetical protein